MEDPRSVASLPTDHDLPEDLLSLSPLHFPAQFCSFTDDPVHDPYSATRGLFYAHCGWIFLKPKYERIKTVERDDLDADPGA